jgi:hypothetical protein
MLAPFSSAEGVQLCEQGNAQLLMLVKMVRENVFCCYDLELLLSDLEFESTANEHSTCNVVVVRRCLHCHEHDFALFGRSSMKKKI